jgi:hypothetical protein
MQHVLRIMNFYNVRNPSNHAMGFTQSITEMSSTACFWGLQCSQHIRLTTSRLSAKSTHFSSSYIPSVGKYPLLPDVTHILAFIKSIISLSLCILSTGEEWEMWNVCRVGSKHKILTPSNHDHSCLDLKYRWKNTAVNTNNHTIKSHTHILVQGFKHHHPLSMIWNNNHH